jgi:PREDICTED: similar to out at first protein
VDFFHRPSDNKTSLLCKDSKVKVKDSKIGVPCTCQVEVCNPWYPCALKTCKSKDNKTGKLVTYRCGIKACKKCNLFNFKVENIRDCLGN